MEASAATQHGDTMAEANKRLGSEQAGVAASAADIAAYKAAYRG
jgi:hypothetical protein